MARGENESDLIAQIVLRCVVTVCPDLKPDAVCEVAEPLINAVTDAVVLQHEQRPVPPLLVNTYIAFEIFNRILDEIAKEIPATTKLDVVTEGVLTRAQRRQYRERYGNTP